MNGDGDEEKTHLFQLNELNLETELSLKKNINKKNE